MSTIFYLGPEQVLLRVSGAVHRAEPAEPGWAGALAAVEGLLASHKPAGRVTLVLSSHFAPLWLLPGAPTRLNYEETRGWVESQAAERFGELAANWRFAFSPAPAGQPILASGIDAGHWAELLRILAQAGLTAVAAHSWPALALARYARRGNVRLALVEAGRLTLVSLARGEPVALDSVRGEPRALAELTARAALVDGLGDAPTQLVGTGVAGDWRAVRVLANAPEAALLPARGELDFLRTRPRHPPAAWLLLLAGLALAGLAGQRYQQLDNQLAALAPPPPPAARSATSVRPRGEVVAAMAPARAWGDLLNRLESGRPKQIALLSLRGDALRGEARISAEARTEADMLAWLMALRGDPGFADASMTHHELLDEEGRHPVRFELQLHWGGR